VAVLEHIEERDVMRTGTVSIISNCNDQVTRWKPCCCVWTHLVCKN